MTVQGPAPDHVEIQELLGAYALDAVDRETAALIERHLDECVRCSIEVAQHHEVAGLLANSGGTSPAELWDGIASKLDGSAIPSWEGLAGRLETGGDRADRDIGAGGGPAPEHGDASSTVVPITSRRGRGGWAVAASVAVAAVAAAVAIVLGVQVHHLDDRVSALSSHPSLTAAEQAVLNSPSTTRVTLRPAAGSPGSASGTVTVALTPSGTGFVEAGGLSALPGDRTYQLWGVIGGQTISLGLMGPDPRVVPFSVAGGSDVNAFAVTAEQSGGVAHSTNQPVVAGTVRA